MKYASYTVSGIMGARLANQMTEKIKSMAGR